MYSVISRTSGVSGISTPAISVMACLSSDVARIRRNSVPHESVSPQLAGERGKTAVDPTDPDIRAGARLRS
ncbi:Uncharacterised protein [Mycobacteroides abscessus subsp. abscessus]|nr:Uncharacterised protein [Mycobacteroides abscessus subsp. abscessus]